MTRMEAIQEERKRYLTAILSRAMKKAHIHMRTLHRLAGNGYTNWSHEADGVNL